MKYIFYLAFATGIFSSCTLQKESACTWHESKQRTVAYIEKQKFVRGFRWIDMGGASDNLISLTRGYVSPRDFKFTLVDTKEPKVRMVRNVVRAHVTLQLGSNDDTGKDELEVYTENGKRIFSMTFGQFEKAEFSFSFSQPTTIFFKVSNSSMPNNTPGAFQTTVFMRGIFAQKTYVRVRVIG